VSSQPISFADLSDEQLVAEVKRLAGSERRATAALIRALIELDARRLYLGEGYSSLFTYCTQALHLAEGAAYNRIETARAAGRFPMILDGLENGSLTLTTVRLLAPHLTVENHESVLTSAHHKRKQDIEQIFDRALTLLLNELERRVCALTPSPRRPREGSERSRHIPAPFSNTTTSAVRCRRRCHDGKHRAPLQGT
jgi:hypothetical protein